MNMNWTCGSIGVVLCIFMQFNWPTAEVCLDEHLVAKATNFAY